MSLAQMGREKEHYIRGEQSVRLLGVDDEFCRRLEEFEAGYRRDESFLNDNFEDLPEAERIYWNTELRNRREMIRDFVELLRMYPHMPLKATTNTGDTEALPLDFQGMHDFLKLKVETALRLDPDGTAVLAERAQSIGQQYIQNLGGERVIPMVNEIQITPLPGDPSAFIAQNAVYGERLAATGRNMGIDISSFEGFVENHATFSPTSPVGLT